MTETPSKPWESVAADFCGPYPSGELVMVVIDERTRYPEVEIVNSTSSHSTIIAMEKMFATHGNPVRLKTDNGPPFKSNVFKEFMVEKGIEHHRITPRWPEANGLVENFMKSVGKITKAANTENKDWKRELFRFLANYRDTPHPNTGIAPRAEMIQRDIRSKIPIIKIEKEREDNVKERDMAIKEKQKVKTDEKRRTKGHGIEKGDTVIVKQEKKNKLSTPYNPKPHIVEEVKGSMITARTGTHKTTRNSSYFKKIPEEAHLKIEEQDPDPDQEEVDIESTIQEPREEEEEILKTDQKKSRFGRTIKRPKYLEDYQLK